jgi:hypothetical protein
LKLTAREAAQSTGSSSRLSFDREPIAIQFARQAMRVANKLFFRARGSLVI